VSNGFINGANFNGGVTTLSGQAEAGDTVTVTDGTNVYNAMVASNGSWTAQISGLANGQSYSYTATATDAVGNTATSDPFGFTVDTTPPTVASVTENIAVNPSAASVTVNAVAADPVGVSSVTVNGAGSASLTSGSDTSGTWSYTDTPFQNGKHTYSVTAADAAGNTSSPPVSGSTVYYNNSAQTLAVVGTAGGDTVATSQKGVTATITDRAGGDNSVTATGGSSWVEINDKTGGDTIGVSGDANTVVLTGASAGSSVNVNGLAGHDVARVNGGAAVTIADTALKGGYNTVTANGGGNWVAVNDTGGNDTISVGGNGNTVTLSGTGGGDRINFGAGGGDTLALDAMPSKGDYDSISNFIAKSNGTYSHDTIDVSALGITAVDNNFTVNKGVVDLAADSVAWLTAGNQSAVYINASSSTGAATDALLVNGSLNATDFKLAPGNHS